MKRFLLLITACIAFNAGATDYPRLTARMNDHFNHAEWQEVLQVTESMIAMRPTDVEPYSAAIIAAGVLNDIPSSNKYLQQSQNNRVHIDSLLHHIYVRTRLIHNAQVYETLLLNLKAHNKGLARVFNIYLLDFYAFARKTHETIIVADELLKVTPDNIRFKKIKADALFYQGDTQSAVELYEDIFKTDPTDYDTITFLAAYYTAQADSAIEQLDNEYNNATIPYDAPYSEKKQYIINTLVADAIDMYNKARNIRTSEFIEKEITRLSNLTGNPPTLVTKKSH